MKYKVGDTVRIKSIDWYNENKDVYGDIGDFVSSMAKYCGETAKIIEISVTGSCLLDIDENRWFWLDYMFDENFKKNNMEQKEVKICVPDGYEIDEEKSTFEKIVFKKKPIKTWDDLVGINRPKESVYINDDSQIIGLGSDNSFWGDGDKNIFVDERHAKSALAMAQISQLIVYYGGAITDEEWGDRDIKKYVIEKYNNKITLGGCSLIYFFLAFHTVWQRDEFFKNNEQLVKDYLMIE
jgi:hypothetical protein